MRCPKRQAELGKRDLSIRTLEELTHHLRKNMSKDVLVELVNYKTGRTISKKTLEYLKKLTVIDEYKDGDETLSSGAATLNWLKNKSNVDYVAYFGELSDANDTVRVRKQVKKRPKLKDQVSDPPLGTLDLNNDTSRDNSRKCMCLLPHDFFCFTM